MYGAIIGDIIGSTYEWHNVKTKDFELFPQGSRFTDDTVLTAAAADKLLNGSGSSLNNRKTYALWYKQYYRRYPNAGYGQMFSDWANDSVLKIQRSYGNGAAMRVIPIGWAFDDIKQIKREAADSCYYTHNHAEAKRGAEAAAISVFLARKGCDKDEIRRYITKNYNYTLTPLDELRGSYVFDSRASYSVPPAIEAFLESDSYEDAVRNAVSIGGDSDTIACIAGGISEAFYGGVPQEIMDRALPLLDIGIKRTAWEFAEKYMQYCI